MNNKEALIDMIQSAVAEYSWEYCEGDFDIIVAIKAEDGWIKAEIKEE
jgi:hypothetical protein